MSVENNPAPDTPVEKKKLPVSFKVALLLFFVSLQCFLGALYLKERESYYKLEALVSTEEAQPAAPVKPERAFVELEMPARNISIETPEEPASEEMITEEAAVVTPKKESFAVVAESREMRIKVKGTLWFDRQNENYVVTLGQKNGIANGALLKIYDAGSIIGQAQVVTAMEKLSIVSIDDADREKLTKTYYKVSLE
jgi:hypothetical protein